MCQVRRQRQPCDSRHHGLWQRSPRQAQVGQAVLRQAKSHFKSASIRLCFGRGFLPVFLDLHALASTSKLHVTFSVTSTRLQCFYITHTHYYSLYPSIHLSLSHTHTPTPTTHSVDSIGGINTCLVQPSMHSRCLPVPLSPLCVLYWQCFMAALLRNRTTPLSLFTD